MKRTVGLLLLVALLALGGWVAYRFVALDSPADAAARIEAIHAEHDQMNARITGYLDAMRLIGTPFRAASNLSGLVERIDTARNTTIQIAGNDVSPWAAIQEHTPGADLVDEAVRAIGDVVRLGSAVEEQVGALQRAAVAYMVAREAASSDPSVQTVRTAATAAEQLATHIAELRDRVSPLATAINGAAEQVDGAVVWLDGVTPEGAQEGIVITGLRTALRALGAAIHAPEQHIDQVVADMNEDIDALREIGTVDDALRGPLF